LLVGRWALASPAPPTIPPNADQATVRAILDNYQALQKIALEPVTTLFDSIIGKALLPIFTSVVGYIGSREK